MTFWKQQPPPNKNLSIQHAVHLFPSLLSSWTWMAETEHNFLCLPLKRRFLLRLQGRAALPEGKILREVLPSAGRCTKERPCRLFPSLRRKSTPLCSRKGHLSTEAGKRWMEFGTQESGGRSLKDEQSPKRARQDVRGYCCHPLASEQALRHGSVS